MSKTIMISLLSITALLSLWTLAALVTHSPLLPSPIKVVSVVIREIESGQLPYHLGVTLRRLMIGFSLSMILGTLVGVSLGCNEALNRFFDSWLILFLNIPALVTIILCYVWFGLTEVSAILAVIINKVPNVIITLREGTKAIDLELLEMAKVFRFGRLKTLRHVIWPQLAPYLFGSARSGLGLIWKIILVVELLGRSNGIGYQLHLYFQLFDVTGILAYSLAFVLIVQMIEWLILKPLETHTFRWRR